MSSSGCHCFPVAMESRCSAQSCVFVSRRTSEESVIPMADGKPSTSSVLLRLSVQQEDDGGGLRGRTVESTCGGDPLRPSDNGDKTSDFY